jgi:hypothetical protein
MHFFGVRSLPMLSMVPYTAALGYDDTNVFVGFVVICIHVIFSKKGIHAVPPLIRLLFVAFFVITNERINGNHSHVLFHQVKSYIRYLPSLLV